MSEAISGRSWCKDTKSPDHVPEAITNTKKQYHDTTTLAVSVIFSWWDTVLDLLQM